ncbi:MAG TPA: hypothetical protein PLD20_28185 [Blastocatellia bacterium]|nr:hypothetical protein [Blastocatellia bacterium]HMV84740.1 hypothetical protein [Blastocatellia bacterium]HMX29006.1 hypothetical protein [Blastocatellia bacterium]HMY73931.1 hypothetical protein [Blastocatellia bacterium]HMZ21844.1 hypothetical protein [Blastocatellia bacterium]
MGWIARTIKWIMLVSGILTCTMIYAVVLPQQALLSMFGESLNGPLAEIIARNWGALITLVGAQLIYGAYNPTCRRLILFVAGLSKVIFIGLVLAYGRNYLGHQVSIAIIVDSVMVLLFLGYFLSRNQD